MEQPHFIHSLNKFIFIELLLCASHYSRCWDTEVNQAGNDPALVMLVLRWGEQRGRDGMRINREYVL